MNYKKFCKNFFISAGVTLGLYVILVIAVDPLGIIGSPIIRGFNHYKSKQDVYQYVWKPYAAVDSKADVIFIGTCRVRTGWQPSLIGYSENKIFNLGLSDFPFLKMKKHLEMLYNTHCPKILVIGIDFFQFTTGNYQLKREGYSEERLGNLAKNNMFLDKLMAVRDSLSIGGLSSFATIKDSILNKNKNTQYFQGFDTERGNSTFNKEAVKLQLKSYPETYRNFQYEPRAIEILKKIIYSAKNKGAKIYVFVNPIHKQAYDLLCSYGHEENWKEIKREVAKIAGKLYELQDSEKYISNNLYYCDLSRYNIKLGEILKTQILADKTDN